MSFYIFPDFDVVRDAHRCINCRACETQCANGVHRYDEKLGVMLADEHKCVDCQRCVSFCPTHALKIVKNPNDFRENANWHTDTIKEISKANQSEREELCRQSNTMISKAKEETMQWLFQAPMEETIRSLQEKCTEIVEDSYSYLSRKIDFGTREQKLLKKVLNASLQRMIKEPIQELKHLETRQEQADYKKMVEQLFGIETKKGK